MLGWRWTCDCRAVVGFKRHRAATSCWHVGARRLDRARARRRAPRPHGGRAAAAAPRPHRDDHPAEQRAGPHALACRHRPRRRLTGRRRARTRYSTASSRSNARLKTSAWRWAPQRLDVDVAAALQRQLDRAVVHRDARVADRLVARALELLGDAQQRRAAGEQLLVALAPERRELAQPRLALAVVARGLADHRRLARREAGQAGVEDQVARVLVVVVVVDRRADVVEDRGGPEQLALVGPPGVQPGVGQRVPHLERELGDVLGVRRLGVVLGGEVAHRRLAHVGQERRPRRRRAAPRRTRPRAARPR